MRLNRRTKELTNRGHTAGMLYGLYFVYQGSGLSTMLTYGDGVYHEAEGLRCIFTAANAANVDFGSKGNAYSCRLSKPDKRPFIRFK